MLRQQVQWYLQRQQPVGWEALAEIRPRRTEKECQQRWEDFLDPILKKGKWTPGTFAQALPPSLPPSDIGGNKSLTPSSLPPFLPDRV